MGRKFRLSLQVSGWLQEGSPFKLLYYTLPSLGDQDRRLCPSWPSHLNFYSTLDYPVLSSASLAILHGPSPKTAIWTPPTPQTPWPSFHYAIHTSVPSQPSVWFPDCLKLQAQKETSSVPTYAIPSSYCCYRSSYNLTWPAQSPL